MQSSYVKSRTTSGFTLIELSIVLVIIGLIVGGVLVGQDLIRAAEVRATLSQIQRYNAAVNTFYGKYQAIPGDMNLATAETFGFSTAGRGGGIGGQGDGNGILTGANPAGNMGYLNQGYGETSMFWVDISSQVAGSLIDGGFNTATFATFGGTVSGTGLVLYFPTAKLGRGNMIYVYEQGGINYYGMSGISSVSAATNITGYASMSPLQAYNIDKKMDDGIATAGNVQANFLNTNVGATYQITADPAPAVDLQSGNAVSGAYTATTCFDTNSGFYVTQFQNGQGASCGLSFKFQ